MSKFPLISIVSINWNSREDILQLLSSIKASSYPKNKIEVIVVDNASTDDSIAKIRKRYPKTKVIKLSRNIGIPARNFGLKKARGEVIFSIDSDVSVSKNLFREAVGKIQSDPKIGVLGVKVLGKKNHRLQPSTIKLNFYTGAIHPVKASRETESFTFLAGLIHIFPKSTLRKVGFYPKNLFFYGDDLDFCLRVKAKGLKVIYFPKVSVLHGKSKKTPDIPFSIKYHHYYKALFRNLYTYATFPQKILATISQLILIPAYRLATPHKSVFTSRWWGFWWNVKNAQKETKLLLGAFLIGLILRLLALNQRDFWFDETFTYHLARLSIPDLLAAVLSDNNPPLYYLLVHYILKIGKSTTILRFPSLIFNLAVIPLMYSVFRQQTNKRAAIIATGLFAVSPLSIYVATEARLHSLAMLIVVALLASFFSLRRNPAPKKIVFFTLLVILGFYTQYYIALLFIPLTWIVAKYKSKLKLKKWFTILFIASVTLMPWLALSVITKHNGCSCPNTILSLPASLVSPVLAGVGEVTLRSYPGLTKPVLLLFATTTFILLFLFLKGLTKNFILAVIYFIPLTILSILGLFLPVFSPKAFAIYSPLFFAIVGLGIISQKKSKIITRIALLLLTSITVIQYTNTFFAGTKLKQIYDLTKQVQTAPIVHTSVFTYYSLNYYTLGDQKNILITSNPLSIATLDYIGGKQGEIDKQTEILWLVDTDKWVEVDDYDNAVKKISKSFSIDKEYRVDNIKVSLLVRK